MDNLVTDYGWKDAQSACSGDYLAREVLSLLKGLRSTRVLDLGAGNGHLCGELKAAGFDAVGVEYDGNGVNIARKAHPSVPFYNFGVQDDPKLLLEKEAPFDTVVSTEVIEHLFSPHLLPAYARSLLQPKGYLVVSTPYHGYLKNLAIALAGKWDQHHTALWHGGHIKFWSRGTLARLLEDAGFEVLAFRGAGRLPFLWKSMILVARRRD